MFFFKHQFALINHLIFLITKTITKSEQGFNEIVQGNYRDSPGIYIEMVQESAEKYLETVQEYIYIVSSGICIEIVQGYVLRKCRDIYRYCPGITYRLGRNFYRDSSGIYTEIVHGYI